MKKIILILSVVVFFTACSKKEINATASGIGDGVKNIADGIHYVIVGKSDENNDSK